MRTLPRRPLAEISSGGFGQGRRLFPERYGYPIDLQKGFPNRTHDGHFRPWFHQSRSLSYGIQFYTLLCISWWSIRMKPFALMMRYVCPSFSFSSVLLCLCLHISGSLHMTFACVHHASQSFICRHVQCYSVSLRFPGQLSSDLRKLVVNTMIFFLHHFFFLHGMVCYHFLCYILSWQCLFWKY